MNAAETAAPIAASPLRKAAILVVSLEQPLASQLLAQLDRPAVEAVTLEIARLERVDPAEQQAVLEEFYGLGLRRLRFVFEDLVKMDDIDLREAYHDEDAAVGLLALAGAARTLLDVTVRTLLQRTVPADVLARVFGLIETLDSAGLAIGSMLAPALVGVLGPRAAIAGLAAIFPALLLLTGRALRHIDADADVPVVDIALLRSLAIFESVGAPVLEGLARASVSLEIGAGQCLIREGEAGDRYYAIADGTLAVTKGTELLRTVGRGHGVGEVALLAGVPRTATVTAQTPASLLAIDADQFMAVVTQHPASARVGGNLVRERLRSPR